ncbi:winged helix-turn-helix domain-containing protein [Pseudoduganella namucuonensis]|uniref:Two-component system, OmpR family, phosphate regulon response regulator PhoB n=1 Tax=Pseudoduganella namucuonensis TaxID=1035707 RepID=A0A1I7LYD1_9BURK|nr:winged helix-turn-helix domain-containing protein [Pseudoduganella namucuonensis]SFV14607.1 two-component system, OmpR family, phosphate regulon response regulator PhoB [Pseudoduganella namucuonensis]
MPVQILVIDSDPAVQQLLALNCRQAGHQPACVADAESALLMLDEAAPEALPDVLLLEWDLPGQSGLSLIRRLRARAGTRELPIIMLSERAAEADKVLALESGADDYMTKPLAPREMLARLHAVLRRRQPQAAPGTVQMAGLRLDPGTLRVTAGARQLSLGRVEFRLLNFLMHHPERVHSRAQLLDQVWGRHVYLDERTVDAHVGRLRSALQPSGHHDHIETVRGSGYRFVAWDAGLKDGWAASAAAVAA